MKLVIFDQDLRVQDNPALFFACQGASQDQQTILPIFIFDQVNKRPLGGASKWFLHQALKQLQHDLKQELALELLIFQGPSLKILSTLLDQKPISEIYFNRLYEPFNLKLEKQIKDLGQNRGLKVFDFKSYLLFEPNEIKNVSGKYFKVFTPFWKKCLRDWDIVKSPLPEIKNTNCKANLELQSLNTINLDNLNLISYQPDWSSGLKDFWVFNQKEILTRFSNFLHQHLGKYKEDRNFPFQAGTSKLGPYLHFGLISINQIVDLVKKHHRNHPEDKAGTACFLSELGWREFSHHLLYNFPELPKQNFKEQFNNFAWQNNPDFLKKWQKGKTGYPIVDAGMRELWHTGFMHNRLRMIVASFLIKDLLIDWRLGEEWFWDCLCDANLANNSAGWQWVAGSGADSAPYYRIFNPVLQGEKFDPLGEYVKKWLPELKNIPDRFIHSPWKLSDSELYRLGVVLGKNYPQRMVIHEQARNEALARYKAITKANQDDNNKEY